MQNTLFHALSFQSLNSFNFLMLLFQTSFLLSNFIRGEKRWLNIRKKKNWSINIKWRSARNYKNNNAWRMKIMQNESLAAIFFPFSNLKSINYILVFCFNELPSLVSLDFLPPYLLLRCKNKQYLNLIQKVSRFFCLSHLPE